MLAGFLWCSLALSALAPKPKDKEIKEATPPQATEKKIDYSQIQWRTAEQFKAAIIREERALINFHPTSTGVFKTRPEYPIPTASPLYDTAGYTYYDLGSNARLGRWIAVSALKHVHVVWTKSTDSVAITAPTNPRSVAYSAWFNTGVPSASEIEPTQLIENPRSGFPAVAVTEDGRGVMVYHNVNEADGNSPGTYVSVEITPSDGDFEVLQKAPDSTNKMGDYGIWPSIATQTVNLAPPNDSVIIHVVSNEGVGGAGNTDYVYGRGRELGGGITWNMPVNSAVSPDSGDDISATVVASQKSGKVAIVYSSQRPDWSAPATDEDIFYIESTDYGRDWVNGFNNNTRDTAVNVTKYSAGSPVRATGVLSAVYDENDSLHIVWLAPLYNAGDVASECILYHWSRATGIDQVADGTYNYNDNYLTEPARTFNLNVPAIGVHDGTNDISRKGYLYVVWNQYGPGLDLSARGQANGEIYINASTNGGNTWGNPINLTSSPSPGCDSGPATGYDCDSDVFPSCAERVNDTVHVLYINDKSAGGALDSKGKTALNPVYYYKYPAYLPAAFNGIAASPPYFDDAVANISIPDLVIDTIITITNVGNQTLTIDSVKKVGGSPWLKLQTTGFPDAIPEGGAPKVVACTLNGTGLGTATYVDTIIVYNNSNNSPTMKVPVHFVVTDCGYFRRKHVVGGTGSPAGDSLYVKIGNTTSLVDQDLALGMWLTSIPGVSGEFLYDGSGVLVTVTSDGDTIAAYNMVGDLFVHPLSDLNDPAETTFTDSVAYQQALSLQRPAKAGTWLKFGPVLNTPFYPDLSPSCLWPGPYFGYWIESTWYMKSEAKPRYLLWFTKIYKSPPPCWWPLCETDLITNNLYAGSVLDWDIRSDSNGIWNSYGENETLGFVWQRGYGTPEINYFAATAAMVDTGASLKIGNPNGFWSAKVHRHNPADSVVMDFPNDAGILYRVMSDSGFNPIPKATDTMLADRHTIFGSVCFPSSAESISFCQALVIHEAGYDSLKGRVVQARLDMRLPLPGGCTYRPADVDGNGSWTLTDIVGLVNMVFKGTQKPTPLCRTDCNASGGNPNLTDIVCLVNKVFKGAANPPPSGECCKP